MCGIIGNLGETNLKGFQPDILSHRGPDSSGIWIAPEGKFPAALGHTRLSIIGLDSSGNQPMLSRDGRYVLVFNGEIYNFIELKLELEKSGYEFTTKTDTEILLYGLIDQGPQFMLKCNGMWAYCLWDSLDNTAIFGRDRFGKKPLYFAELPQGSIAFASEMKGLYPYLSSVEPSNDIEIHLKKLFDYEHTERCVVKGITRLPPGYYATWSRGQLSVRRWWNTLDHLYVPPSKYEDQVEQWREIFLDAVRLRMRADVKIGTALSGGLDSSATFSAMAYMAENGNTDSRSSSDWQHGFCAHYPDSTLDESEWAKLVTDSFHLPLELVKINPTGSKWSLKEAFYQVEDPYLTMPTPMLELYRAISHAGVKVTLDGHGADELFSGYGHIPLAYIRASSNQMLEIDAIERSTRTGRFKQNTSSTVSWRVQKQFSAFSRPYVERLKDIVRGLPTLTYTDQKHPAFLNMTCFDQALYELFHITTLPTLLRNYDRYSMANGVEIRMPFLDYRLVCFTFSLPWTSKLGGGFTKRILRDAMKGIVPEPVRTRRDKIGWNAPLHEWLASKSLMLQIDSMTDNCNSGEAIIKIWNRYRKINSPDFMDGQRVWSQLLPYMWKQSLRFNQD